jgi:hypothetical protein
VAVSENSPLQTKTAKRAAGRFSPRAGGHSESPGNPPCQPRWWLQALQQGTHTLHGMLPSNAYSHVRRLVEKIIALYKKRRGGPRCHPQSLSTLPFVNAYV